MTQTSISQRIHVLAKPTGSTCNLNCSYCFYLQKEQLYPGSRFRMSDEVLESYISQLIECHRTDTVTVAWQGGEPTLMGVDFYRRAIALQEKYRRPGMRFENTLQTNGTLLNDEWCEFLRKNNFLVGISIDGPRRLHDTYRVDRAGKPTFDRAMRGPPAAAKARGRVQRPGHGQPQQRGSPARGLPVFARPGQNHLDAVHSGDRANQPGNGHPLSGRDDRFGPHG